MIGYKKCFVFLSIFLVLKLASTTSVETTEPCTCMEDCPDNEKYSECENNACQNTCANPNMKDACEAPSKSGCICIDGYLRNSKGICIPIRECFNCGEYEIFTECGNHGCQNTCFQPHLLPVCTMPAGCFPGCKCIDGYLRNDRGKCVPEDTCDCSDPNAGMMECPNPCAGGTCEQPKFSPCKLPCKSRGCQCYLGFVKNKNGMCIPLSKCPKPCKKPNEEYMSCGTNCPPTCANRNPICTQQCVEGCFCKKGYIRNNKGDCILIKECPPQCKDPNSEYSTCRRCVGTCQTPIIGCSSGCIAGCACKEGYLRTSETNDTCIKIVDCPPQCKDPNSEYSLCKRCVGTCETPSISCSAACIPGCACKKGYLRTSSTNNKCIKINDCPKICKKPNEVYDKCGTKCPPTCDNKYPKCTKDCAPGCFCKPGFIRKIIGGECIDINKCPVPTCGLNEEYDSCCDCSEDDDPPCVPGCKCKKGYIKNKDGKCVPEEPCDC